MAKSKRRLGTLTLEIRMAKSQNLVIEKVQVPDIVNVNDMIEDWSIEESYHGFTSQQALKRAVSIGTLAAWEWLQRWQKKTLTDDVEPPAIITT